jgi:hypothetical protein
MCATDDASSRPSRGDSRPSEICSAENTNQELLKSAFRVTVRQRKANAHAYYVEKSIVECVDEFSVFRRLRVKVAVIFALLFIHIWLLAGQNANTPILMDSVDVASYCLLRTKMRDDQISIYLKLNHL